MCVCRVVGPRLVASMRIEPQVSLPGGTVARFSVVKLPDGCDERQTDSYESVKPLKVDRFTVTNADFMYQLQLLSSFLYGR